MRMELSLRPDYASIVPWVESMPDGVIASAGPDAFRLSTVLPLEIDDGTVRADFVAVEGARQRLSLTWHLSHEESPPVEDADAALAVRRRGGESGADAAPIKVAIATRC